VWMLVVGAIGVIVLGTALVIGPGGGRFGGGQTLTLSNCQPKTTSGSVVDVTLSDRGGGMMGGGSPMMVSLVATPSSIPSGPVTFVAANTGALNHELLILPLPSDGAGTRAVGTDGKIDEQSSLGEASTSCGRGPGNGISPGTRSWVTVKLAPGRYELLCDEPWHYANGMFAEFTVS
jgi:Sulfocyanin (SoxE) domain